MATIRGKEANRKTLPEPSWLQILYPAAHLARGDRQIPDANRRAHPIQAQHLELLNHRRTVMVGTHGLVIPLTHQRHRRSTLRIKQANPGSLKRHDPTQLI
jgi:hypothetical protein